MPSPLNYKHTVPQWDLDIYHMSQLSHFKMRKLKLREDKGELVQGQRAYQCFMMKPGLLIAHSELWNQCLICPDLTQMLDVNREKMYFHALTFLAYFRPIIFNSSLYSHCLLFLYGGGAGEGVIL